MLEECFEYLERRSGNEAKFSYEIIIVNDGSRDRTTDVAMRYVEKYGSEKVRLLALTKNRGKGGAVRLVMNEWQFVKDCLHVLIT